MKSNLLTRRNDTITLKSNLFTIRTDTIFLKRNPLTRPTLAEMPSRCGNSTGSWDSGTGTEPHEEQWMMGMGVPQYLLIATRKKSHTFTYIKEYVIAVAK